MPSRNVSLSDHFDSFIETSIAEGRFSNASEAVRAGLHLLERQAAEEKAKIEWLSGAVQEGIDAMERGEFVTLGSDDEIDRYVSGVHDDVMAARAGRLERV